MTYIPRLVDAELKRRLASSGAVIVEGPKACGKTATARQRCASEVLLDVDDNARETLTVAPGLVLDGPTPRLIDEWQIEPAVWNHVRRAVDDRTTPGQFVLTGSAHPADSLTRHTGAGRFSRVCMRPLSLFESGHSTGAISLEQLLEGNTETAGDPGLTLYDVASRIAIGGWPGSLSLADDTARDAVRDYLDEVVRVDVKRMNGVRHDPQRVYQVVRSLARNVATEATITSVATDAGGQDKPLNRETVTGYIAALQRLMIIEDQPAWAPHLRSRSRLRSTPKRHFTDPSLAAGALNAHPDRLLRDLNFLGLLFESLVVRDLRVYAQVSGNEVLHYRDNTGLEVDAIVESPDGRWAGFEVKLGGSEAIDTAAANLHRFADRIDTSKCGEPGTLAVIVAGGYGYVREDGIAVYPVGALAP